MTTRLTGPVRVRFAPSPTGYLHVGGARTAIFNELLRQNLGGSHILRIEDTDRARSDDAMTTQITTALAWLGIDFDEGPVLQSAGVERHRAAAFQLVAEGKAYHDFVPAEALAAKRQEAESKGVTFRYNDFFPEPSKEEIERRVEAGEAYSIRFRMPDRTVTVHDLVRGDVTFPPDTLGDLVILRSDGSPTYHLTVVCDDIAMGITHVVRGEDHLSNTPKHVALFEALGAGVPAFAHLPLILGPGKKRLSKRTGATSVEEFRDQGILPGALYNYLAFLGWSPGDEREVMQRDELIEAFTVERVSPSASVFDPDKLAWMNGLHMSATPLDEVLGRIEPFLPAAGLEGVDPARLRTAVDLHRTRAKTLPSLAQMVVPYFLDTLDYPAEGCLKFCKQPDLPAQLEQLIERYAGLDSFDIEGTEQAMRALAEELEVKAGVLIHPTRMALSGDKKGPSLFDLVVAMGQEATLRHLRQFVAYLRAHPASADG